MIQGLIIFGGILYAGYEAYKAQKNKEMQESFKPKFQRNSADFIQIESSASKTKNSQNLLVTTPDETLQPLSKAEIPENYHEQEINTYLQVSMIALGVSVAGSLAFPALKLVSVPLLIYTYIPIFKNAWKSLFIEHHIRASVVDSIAGVATLATHYYVASSVAGLAYFLGVKFLYKTEDHSKKQIGTIFGKTPGKVWLFKDQVEIEIPFEKLQVGDVIILQAGDLIPVDGLILNGIASVDQRILTGEAQPVEKMSGDPVFAATYVISGKIQLSVQETGEQTTAAKIAQILKNTTDFKSSLELKSVQIADDSSIPTLALGALAWNFLGPISAVAVICCNYLDLVRISAPLGILNYFKIASENGILIKDGRCLELLSEVDTIVFDKTGTLTLEQPHVEFIHVWNSLTEEEVLQLAAAAEFKQTHPIARAILQAAQERSLECTLIDTAHYEVGYGIKVQRDQDVIHVGSHRFMDNEGVQWDSGASRVEQYCNEKGFSLVYVAMNGKTVGALELHTTLRPEAKRVIQGLQALNLNLYVLSGDHETPTRELAQELGIESWFAEVLPQEKAKLIEELQASGKSVCFIGDGINDTVALKLAKVSISLQGASSAAVDTAGIILMDRTLNQLCPLFDLAKDMKQNMKNSFYAAVVPGTIGVTGVFFFHFQIYSSIFLYMIAGGVGALNAMMPVLQHKDRLLHHHRADTDLNENPA
ncbi:heavy metal translocating P-type ATPase [Deltaproteobacteria bacterium TL4]